LDVISRRNFLQILAYGGLSALASQIGLLENYQNVLLIMVDSLNDWALGGHPNAETPNINKLASQGIHFANAHAVGTNSNASRSSFFTGIAPYNSGIYGGEANYRDVYPRIRTLPQQYMAARYRAIGAGRLFHADDKWSWQENPFFEFNNRLVFQSLTGINSGPNFDWGAVDVPESELHDFQITNWAIRKLENLAEPFFLGLGLSTTRHPWYLPPELYNRFDPATVTLPSEATAVLPEAAQRLIRFNHKHELVLEQNLWGSAVAAYLAAMLYVDEQVGRLMTALENSSNAENTIVILASSHGLHLGDKQYWLFDTLWERCTHVPLIIRLPNGTSGVSQRAVSLLDIYPTLLDLFGYQGTHTLDGRSLKPLLENPSAEWDYPVVISSLERDFAVRSNRWRYIRYVDGGEELYEMLGDKQELINQASNPAHQQTKATLRAYIPENPALARL
jgi:arylsulfatase A-like enzyme